MDGTSTNPSITWFRAGFMQIGTQRAWQLRPLVVLVRGFKRCKAELNINHEWRRTLHWGMVFWSKEGWRVADIALFVNVREIFVRNSRIMIETSNQTVDWATRVSPEAWEKLKSQRCQWVKMQCFIFSFDLLPQLKTHDSQRRFLLRRHPSRLTSLSLSVFSKIQLVVYY